ncbi:hypothetical protein [uncultured Novosphingobium sp.]|mgnify:CR=1 FL=1|nr:hypothetical protein [uncultured Novosphingobium sp.]
MIRVSGHAVERYQERVANVSDEAAVAALSSPFIQAPADLLESSDLDVAI